LKIKILISQKKISTFHQPTVFKSLKVQFLTKYLLKLNLMNKATVDNQLFNNCDVNDMLRLLIAL